MHVPNPYPAPPFLVIREGKSFWVEERPVNECTATLQAFHEGCFRHACCYDATGRLWPIVRAVLQERPSLAQRLMPWRQVRVEIHFGTRFEIDLRDVVSKLAIVLGSESEFNDSLTVPPRELAKHFESARTPSDLIRMVIECASGNAAQPPAAANAP
jgi:hypothetical protein